MDLIDNDLFYVYDIDDMIEDLDCGEEGKIMYYHFKRPLGDLDFGLFTLGSDQDVNHLRSYGASHNLIEVYTKFWRTNLHTYAMSPNPTKLKIGEIIELLLVLEGCVLNGLTQPRLNPLF